VPKHLALYNSSLVLDNPAERHGESENALDNALAGGGNSEDPLNGAEHLARRAQLKRRASPMGRIELKEE